MKATTLLATAVAAALPTVTLAQLYSQDFDADASASFTFNSSTAGDTANDGADNEADYFFDYSTVGIPSAPNSVGGSTIGLKLEANIPDTDGGAFQGFSVSPTGQSFSGDYVVTYDRWENYNFASTLAGGSGRSQFTSVGVGNSGVNDQFPGGTIQGFVVSNDASSFQTSNYRLYTAGGAPAAPDTGYYSAGTGVDGDPDAARSVTNPYYSDSFPAQAAPAAQVALFPEQAGGSTDAGSLGFAWHEESITVTDDDVTWVVDGVTLAVVPTADLTLDAAGNISFGQFDVNTGSASEATDPNVRSLLFGLFDNVAVSQAPVPEPASLGLLGVAGLGLIRRRR